MFKDKILKLNELGCSRKHISKALGCSIDTVHRHLKNRCQNREIVIALRMDGYYIHEVEVITGLNRVQIMYYSKGYNFAQYRPTKNKIKMKKIKRTKIEQTKDLEKGMLSGSASKDIVIRESRNEGRTVEVRYKGLDSIKIATIFVRDIVTDLEACERWSKRTGNKLA